MQTGLNWLRVQISERQRFNGSLGIWISGFSLSRLNGKESTEVHIFYRCLLCDSAHLIGLDVHLLHI
jgi:hypothetical protein